jgi:rhodanese-related sulfurtransferase
MPLTAVEPEEAERLIAAGAKLIDIRDADEHARERISGAANQPLARIEQLASHSGPVIFHCRTGMRTQNNADRLAAASGSSPSYVLAGGIDSWRSSGRLTIVDRRQPLEIMRQVQLVAGGLVLVGVVFGFLVSPLLFGLSAFVGAGLMMAGATGWCGMAKLLQHLPWNRPVPLA